MNKTGLSPKTAVIIATKDRCDLLSQRALPSVIEQSLSPDYLIVVDDSSPENRPRNAALVSSLCLSGCEILYLENHRTPGASGSWNTAIETLFSRVKDPETLFVAFLDDDDAWSPIYLESCYAAASERRLDMVAADLRRFESKDVPPLPNKGPEQLRADDFLVTNPGIQGSNLFLRLSVLLTAGGFDEELLSTTDRDLCIRIADLNTVRYGRLPLALVDHYADPDRNRLSTRGSKAKLAGLTSFWKKYCGRMSEQQRVAFSSRASTLFDWHAPLDFKQATVPIQEAVIKTALVLGIFVDHQKPELLLNLVDKLSKYQDSGLVGLDVILLKSRDLGRTTSDLAAKMLRDAGAGCFQLTCDDNSEAGETTRFQQCAPDVRHLPSPHRDGLLEFYCSRVAQQRPGSQVWLVNDLGTLRNDSQQGHIHDFLKALGAINLSNSVLSVFKGHFTPEQRATADQAIEQERIATALHRVKKRFALDHIRILGSGSEAVVFADDCTVYKCIDYWKTRMPKSQLEFLRGQVGQWANTPGLYPLHSVEEDGPWVVLTYDYEESTPYQGGHEQCLIQLLEGCSSAGIVCNNIHPKNLVVTASGVKLIDYGSDIRRWSPLGFEHMARRAFLSCRYPTHPDLKLLMRRSLSDEQLPELAGYQRFRALVSSSPQHFFQQKTFPCIGPGARTYTPFPLYVGVITSEPFVLLPLLRSLTPLSQNTSIKYLRILILDNGCPQDELEEVVHLARRDGLMIAIISEDQQRRDAAKGTFGQPINPRPEGQVSISHARTMLQSYLGELMKQHPGSVGWILDDDMRVDKRAAKYLPWLPSFREQGADILLGAYEGASPNPPLNGLRVQLLDLFHNLKWLNTLPDEAIFPDRSAENTLLRKKYTDYYYDLSRKHSGHLEMPLWLEPVHKHETVGEARSRLIAGATGILNGDPLTRSIVASMPDNPLEAAQESVNRGGCTFVLNPDALTLTPNSIPRIQGREARRSDMVWAIVNRYYRSMTIKAVGFPIHHVGRVTEIPSLNTEKVQGEIVGSALYAGLTEFLSNSPQHALNFSQQEVQEIRSLVKKHMDVRLLKLEQSFYRIAGLRTAIEAIAPPGKLSALLNYLACSFNHQGFHNIRCGVQTLSDSDIHSFLSSLRLTADDFATRTAAVDFISYQFQPAPTSKQGAM